MTEFDFEDVVGLARDMHSKGLSIDESVLKRAESVRDPSDVADYLEQTASAIRAGMCEFVELSYAHSDNPEGLTRTVVTLKVAY